MDRATFVAAFGGIFEHSPWIAEAAHALELGPAHDTARGVHSRSPGSSAPPRPSGGSRAARASRPGRQAGAGQTADRRSAAEQAGAGLDALTDDERAPSPN
jgi:2-oxo-4-hydroxy-4-carboxy--5-ureidoimidazoline (OHCU) decarboxylase